LGLKPLFIARMAPKHYINMVNKKGGYTLVFVTQIYPYGSGALVAEIEKTLRLPVICPKAIPEGMIERFKNWHKKQLKSV